LGKGADSRAKISPAAMKLSGYKSLDSHGNWSVLAAAKAFGNAQIVALIEEAL